MKTSLKIKLKLNPAYLNKVNESEINDEIILYALENGYDFKKDYDDKFSKYDIYINWNLNNKKEFVNNLVYSKHFDFDKLNVDNKNLLRELLKDNSNLLIKYIEKDIRFVEFLSKDIILDDININSLVWILKNNNISYSMLNEDFLIDNYKLGLEYLNIDFSNIVNFKKYNSNYKNYTKEIIEYFNKDIKNNVKYLSELNDIELDNKELENIVETLKVEGMIINFNTPKFVLEDNDVLCNLIKYDLNNSFYIDREVNFSSEDKEYIINKINEDNVKFDNIPLCFINDESIVRAILKNNINIIDSKEFNSNLYLDLIVDFIRKDIYIINDNTKVGILNYIGENFLEEILEKDFNNIKYFENLNIVYNGLPKNLYNLLKKHNYEFTKLNKIFSSNPYIIKECLDKNLVSLDEISLLDISTNILNEDLLNFKIYIINYAKEKGLSNDVVNKWEKQILDLNRKDNGVGSNIYVQGINNNSVLSYPNNVKEIFSKNNDIDSINLLIDRVKASNNNIEKIVIDLPYELYSLEELESIKDKNMVVFSSEKDLTRITVDEMIKTEKTLDLFVSDIRTSDLSPYERYIAVYNIVKSFKKYRFYKDDEDVDRDYLDQARNIYLIMQNDYIVCVGYASLLETLLKRVGVNSCAWDVVTIDNISGHKRNYVNINDPKYEINGYYMCDVTWDNTQYEMMHNGYDNLNMTTEKSRQEKKFDKTIDPKATLNDEIFNDYTNEEMFNYLNISNNYSNNFIKLKQIMKKLDPSFYDKIKDKELNIEVASEINSYLKTKLNKDISKEKEIRAIFEINQFIEGKRYTKEEYIEKWNEYIMSKMYSHDLLMSNFDEDVNNYVNMFQNIKLNEYFSLFNNQSISNYKKRCISEASIIINNNYLMGDNNTYFGIGYSDKLFMTISIAGDLFRNQKIDEVKGQLENIGYEVITEGVTQFNIILNNKYLDTTLSETYTELENIKNDYLRVYNDVLGTKIK